MLAGAIGDRRDALEPFLQPSVLIWSVLEPLGIGYAARLGVWLPALVVACFLLSLPILNAKYEPLFQGRYLMPIVPLIDVAVAMLAVAAWRRAQAAAGWAGAGVLMLIAALLAASIVPLRAYESAALAEGGNAPYVALAERIRRARQPHERVLLDGELGGMRLASGRGGVGVLEYLLTVRPDPIPVVSGRVDEISAWLAAEPNEYLLVLFPYARQKLEGRYRFTVVGRVSSERNHRLDDARLYRAREVRR